MTPDLNTSLSGTLQLFATSLAIGLLIGIDRERKGDSRGVRTFGLMSVLGTLLALIAARSARPEILAVGLGLIGLISISAYWPDGLIKRLGEPASSQAEPLEAPTTSVVAMVVTGCLGILCGTGQERIAVPLAIVVVSLLYFKGQLEGLAGQLAAGDLIPILQFGALMFIVLPLLPDTAYGPQGSLNPHDIWMMVVLVAGVGLVGFFSLKFAGQRFGAPLAAVAGGLVSSTATTLVFARHSRASGADALLTLLVLLSNLTMLARLCVMAAILQPELLGRVAVLAGSAAFAAIAVGLWLRPRLIAQGNLPLPQVENPTRLRVALGFGLAYGLVSLVAAVASEQVGRGALFGVAALSGLTDVDAISLSSFRLFGAGTLDRFGAITSVGIAIMANMAFKAALVLSTGSRELARLCGIGFAAMAVAVALAITFMQY